MRFDVIESARLGEKVYSLRHETGAQILVEPKKGYASNYAIFGTRYGSIDNRFRAGGKRITVPEGIAHFLEHKLFESEDGGAFERYAKTGASANAYTSFDRTCYLFSCTDRFRESLEILLDFVQHPYFTEETVQKEQGIIGQEIRMYLDDPGWRVFFNMLGALYHNNPVKIDIAGTEQSIAQITADLLYQCYRSFYNLNNMVLAVSGDVDPSLVLDTADRLLKKPTAAPAVSEPADEPESIVRPRVEQKLSVSVPLFTIGFKDRPLDGPALAKKQAVHAILQEILASDASPLYRTLYDRGVINASFGTQYFAGRSFACSVISGESREPDAVADALFAEIARLRREGVSPVDFARAKKSVFGQMVAQYDSVEEIANALAGTHLMRMGPFDLVESAAAVTPEDVEAELAHNYDESKAALSVILPVE